MERQAALGVMQVYNNITAFETFKNYSVNVSYLRKSMSRLSSGLRISSAGDDPAGLAMSERLRAQYRNSAAAAANVENKINYLQTADSWLQKIQDIMGRMTELAVMANDGTKSATDRQNLQREFEEMQKEIQRITTGSTAAAKFNGLFLFRGGTGVGAVKNDLVVGARAHGGARVVLLSHDGSMVTPSSWRAVYNEAQMEWTITNQTTGDEYTVACEPSGGCSIVLDDGTYGFRLEILEPTGGTYGSGDVITWDNTAYVAPVMGSPSLTDVGASGQDLTLTPKGTGEDVTTASWRAVYDAVTELWTVYREGVLQGTFWSGPGGGGSGVFEGSNGFRITIDTPTSGSYVTGDEFTWNNVASVAGPVTFIEDSSATTGSATTSINGTGADISSHSWRATYSAISQAWTIRDLTAGVNVGTISAAPNTGGYLDVEGTNGFRITINAPTGGTEYSTNDIFNWTNRGLPQLGAGTFADNRGTTTATATTAVQGTGAGVTDASWSATYDPASQLWTIVNVTLGTVVTTVSGAPNAGVSVSNIGGVNGHSLTINAPTGGTEFTLEDQFTWTTSAYHAPTLSSTTFIDTGSATTGSSSTSQLGTGLGVTTANWSATYNASTELWTIRNETTGTNVGTLNLAADEGGYIDLQGVNGFRFTINVPTSGTYDTGDRFTWSNTAGSVVSSESPVLSDNRTATRATCTLTEQGTGLGITSSSWTATYDAVARQWTVENLTVPATYTFSGEPDEAAYIDLEGANGFRFQVNVPTSRIYNTGDRFSWTNLGLATPEVGVPVFSDNSTNTEGEATTEPIGDGTGITTADWSATYNAVTQLWTFRNETTGVDVMTYSRRPNQSGTVTLEGVNGFTFTITALTGGRQFNTGDKFTWSNTRLVPPSLENNLTFSSGGDMTGGSASLSYLGDGYDVSESTWRATYDAVNTRWVVRNMTTGVVAGYINAGATEGGTLSNIEGADGFSLTITGPDSGAYTTGDYFQWHNTEHQAADAIGPYYTDIKTDNLRLQVGSESNQVFNENAIDLQSDNFVVIGSYNTYSYGSVNMTLLGSTLATVRWASLICLQHLAIEEQSMAQAAVDKLNIGIDYISSIRAVVGAEFTRMEQTLSGLRNYEENLRATESRIRDVDVAWETTVYSKYKILSQISMAMLAQANAVSAGVLNLVTA